MTAIQKHMLAMLIALRWGVGLAGLLFPIILAGVGHFAYKIPLAGSMSAYYHATNECSVQRAADALKAAKEGNEASIPASCRVTGAGPMRNWFVGNLFFIGGAMLLMRGFSNMENWVLNVAGTMAPCVAHDRSTHLCPSHLSGRSASHVRRGDVWCVGIRCLLAHQDRRAKAQRCGGRGYDRAIAGNESTQLAMAVCCRFDCPFNYKPERIHRLTSSFCRKSGFDRCFAK